MLSWSEVFPEKKIDWPNHLDKCVIDTEKYTSTYSKPIKVLKKHQNVGLHFI